MPKVPSRPSFSINDLASGEASQEPSATSSPPIWISREGEKLHHLVEYLAKEFIGRLDGGIERIVGIALYGAIAVRRFLPIRQLRIGNESRRAVAGNIDLRHDFDVQCRRMRDDHANIILRVITGNRLRPIAELRQKRRIRPPRRADGRQQRVSLDFETPCLVIRQVPMEPVHAQPCKNVDKPHDITGRIELSRDIQMATAPAVTRRIGDGA